MAFGEDELEAALEETGEDLLFGSTVLKAYVDEGDRVETDSMGSEILVRGTSARLATHLVPASLALESEVERVVTEVKYRVRDIRRLADGGLTLLILAKV